MVDNKITLAIIILAGAISQTGCATQWHSENFFAGNSASYVVGKGIARTENDARLNARGEARGKVLLEKYDALSPEVQQRLIVLSDIREDFAAGEITAATNGLSLLTDDTFVEQLPNGWRAVSGKERVRYLDNAFLPCANTELVLDPDGTVRRQRITEEGSNCSNQVPGRVVEVTSLFRFDPERVGGRWLVQERANIFPPVGDQRLKYLGLNILLPGLGSIRMRKASSNLFNHGWLMLGTYVSSLAGYGVVRHIRNSDIVELNQTLNINDWDDLRDKINRYGAIQNTLIGVATGTLLVSVLDALVGEQDLWEFNPGYGSISILSPW